jgi:hypothetical protein
MIKKCLSFIAVILFVVSQQAQAQWPAITKTTKPWARWWWMGSAVDEKGVSMRLNQMSDVGFGGVEIVPIYGAIGYESKYISYLSPRWMQMLDYTTKQADQLKMGVDMAVGTGWPIGGPQVTVTDAATKLTAQRYTIEAGSSLKEKILLKDPKQQNLPGIFLAAAIAYNVNGKAIDITNKVAPDGSLNWTADSSGKWQILAVFNAKTLQAVKRAALGGEGYTLDHFSATSIIDYFKTFDTAFGNSSHGVRSFFNDSYEVFNADWTPDFFNEFKKRRGFDLKPFLKDLLSQEKTEIVGRVKSDYRQTMSDLMLENFTRYFTQWAHSKKALNTNQAHGSPGNLLDLYAAVDIPECETFGSSSFAVKGLRRDSADVRNVDPDPVMLKFASSAAHATGKTLTSSETFTWLTEHFKTSWSQCKPEVEQVFLSGINHVFYHGVTYSPADASFPGWLFYASVNFVPQNSLWPHLKGLNEYITRCQSVLQSGYADNEVKAYWPVFDAWNATAGLDLPFRIHDIDVWLYPTAFYKNVVDLQHKGFSIDFVSDKMLKDKWGKNVLTNRSGHDVYLISQCDHMPVSTLRTIIDLAKQGDVIVMQALPKDVPGLDRLDEQRALLEKIKDSLSFNKINDDISECIVLRGKIILSNNVQKGLEYAKLKRETLTDLGLKFIRRQAADGKYYYIINHTANTIDTTITIEISSASVAILDPQTGTTGLAKSSSAGNITNVKIQLQSGEAVILKTSKDKQNIPAWKYLHSTKEVITLNKQWTVHFISGGPTVPADKKIIGVQNWTTFSDTATQSFSGIASYSSKFVLTKKNAAGYLLDIGKVNESAKIIINGKEAGIMWCLPFTMEIGKYLKQGENTITIEVANLMANRIRYMDQHKMEWRKYHEINFVNINYKSFDASGWKVQPSGLEGPVTITVLK